METEGMFDVTPAGVLVEVGSARSTDHDQAVGGAAMFWGALRRVWDPSCGVALLICVDGPSVRVGFEVTGDDPERVGRYAETMRALARHTMPTLTWRDGTAGGMAVPAALVASFTDDRRREPAISKTPIGLTALAGVEGPWLLRLDLITPLDRTDSGTRGATPESPVWASEAAADDAEVVVSLALYGTPGPAGDAAAALLATDIAGPVSMMPHWGLSARPIELPAQALHHLLAMPARMAALLPAVDVSQAPDLADAVRTLPAPHVLLLGATGSGKSTALVHLAGDALANREPVVCVDTHDGLMLQQVAARAHSEGRPFLMVPFGTPGGPVLDITETPACMSPDLWVENLWSLIRHDLWHTMPDAYFGPVGEKAIRTLLGLAVRVPDFGFADVTRLLDLDDERYRSRILNSAGDPDLARGLRREIMPMIRGGDNAALFVAGKFAPFSSPIFREVVAGAGPRVPLEGALEQGVSLLIHAPSATLGDVPARTLIAAALRRIWAHLTGRRGGQRITILLDEWQRYAAGSALTMLAESRKYRARLVLANQVLTQLSDELRNTALGNVGAIAAYRVSPADSLLLDGVFPSITVRRLQTLPRHTLALTTFESDLVLPGPLPVQPLAVTTPVRQQLADLGLHPSHRRAELTRLATALAELQRQRAAQQ